MKKIEEDNEIVKIGLREIIRKINLIYNIVLKYI
jgi:hypothetical protein